ncbi:MAG TPA: 4-alpha-glucanotransferase [Myxococcales bacterium]|nr:4-alpha-glucanotransferase [Myxococcales bacterium]
MFDLNERSSGVLLHLTSLPGPYGNGDLGRDARRFAEDLAATGQRWWQMLPVGPPGTGNSPYSARSAFAGSPLLIDLAALADDGLLPRIPAPPALTSRRVDYDRAAAFRLAELRRAFANFRNRPKPSSFARFLRRARHWVGDYALFSALRSAHGGKPWLEWERELRLREPAAIRSARRELASEIDFHLFEQWSFDRQWRSFKGHCNELGIGLIGDLPFFVSHDSADVWANQELFELDAEGRPTVVAGVPPDFFSETGQRWGNPHYRLSALRRTGYAWWLRRFQHGLTRFDALRLDHFIGFWRSWQVPATAPTAENGRWGKGPRDELFMKLRKLRRGHLPLIAEDLGLVIPEVRALRDRFELPGMKLLQFAFGDDAQAHEFLPHNYPRRCIAYTGTHDNDTIVGWFFDRGGHERTAQQTEMERRAALAYLGAMDGRDIHWRMLRCIHSSVAALAIAPMQDILGLGSESRMNRPATEHGNWEWRMRPGAFGESIRDRLAALTRIYQRAASAQRAERRVARPRLAAKEARE